MSGRRSWVLGGALAALVVVVALVACLLVRSDAVRRTRARRARSRSRTRPGPRRPSSSWRTPWPPRDEAAAAALAPSDDPRAGDLLAAVVANADALRRRRLLRCATSTTSARWTRRRGWQAAVDLTWRFDGFDQAPVHEEVLVGFQSASGGTVAHHRRSAAGDRRSPLWLSGPVEVRRIRRHLGARDGTAAEADLVAGRAEAAVPVVRDVLPAVAREAGGGGAGARRTASTRALGAEPGQLRRHRGRHGVRGRHRHARRRRCTSSSTRTSSTTSSRSGPRS